jgi:three-Cys-motif partner protein
MSNKFGGPWTIIKLELLHKYLEAYGKVFKNKPYYNLIYLDAFAGSGKCYTNIGVIDGSARIALNVERFNEYIFIEKDPKCVDSLKKLKNEYPNKKINVIQGDCNEEVISILQKYDWRKNRALAFLDPYHMQLSFSTLKTLASTGAFDVWYLFPLSAVTRCLKREGNIPPSVEKKLEFVFGDSQWKQELYYPDPQISFFDEDENIKRKAQDRICCYFKQKMLDIFPSVLCPACLKNRKNSPLFLLYFAVSNKNKEAQKVANKIASHLISKEQTYVCNQPWSVL